MLLRSQVAKNASSLSSIRLLHTTRPSYGFMDWFSLKKSEEKKKTLPVEKPKDINEVIKNAEEGKIEVKSIDNIEFIGVKHRKHKNKGEFKLKTEEQINEKIESLGYNVWISGEKVKKLEDLQKIFVESYNEVTGGSSSADSINLEEITLDDLQFRFDITLKIQQKSGYIIPDKTLTEVTNLQELIKFMDFTLLGNKTYLQKIMANKTLDINDLKFQSPNISIQAPVNSRQRKATYKELLTAAKKAQDYKAEKLINETRSE